MRIIVWYSLYSKITVGLGFKNAEKFWWGSKVQGLRIKDWRFEEIKIKHFQSFRGFKKNIYQGINGLKGIREFNEFNKSEYRDSTSSMSSIDWMGSTGSTVQQDSMGSKIQYSASKHKDLKSQIKNSMNSADDFRKLKG